MINSEILTDNLNRYLSGLPKHPTAWEEYPESPKRQFFQGLSLEAVKKIFVSDED